MIGKHTQKVPGTWGMSCSFHSLAAVFVAVFVILAFYTTRENKLLPVEDQHQEASKETTESKMPRDIGHQEVNKNAGDSLSGCNVFSGKWVYDNRSYPLYKEQECLFIDDGIACEKFGRKDLNYQRWRWQPHDCDLPRFNATAMLEKLRGKRLVFVGDSLNRNQWVSMVCLVQSPIPPELKSMHINGSLITFKAIEYNASIDFYWAPLLVESNSDDLIHHRIPDRIVRVQAIENHARHWTDADILVFNSYLWWRKPALKVLWGSFGSPGGIYKEVEMLRSYEMALRTWSDWLDIHVNRTKTKLFFVSMSPTHNRGQECSFMDDGMACEKFGRKDLNYQHWRWQPHHCDLPRFNAVAMLEMLRGRRLVFVGDSLNRNQWVSMVRLVESSIPPAMKSVDFKFNGSIVTFKATRGLFESKQLQSMLGTGLMQTYWSLILTFGGDGLK